MEQFFAGVLRNAWAVLAAMLAGGLGSALLGVSLPAVVLFLLSGLLLMYLSGQRSGTQVSGDTGKA